MYVELHDLQNDPPEDIHIVISETNILDIEAWIRVYIHLFLLM